MPTTPQLAVAIFILCIYIKKRGASPDARSTIRRLSHCPSCRNEQCWKPHVDVYIIPPYQRAYCSKPKRAVYNTPCRASPLLCSWQLYWNLRDSRIVKTKAYSYALICICRPNLLPSWGLSARVTVAKIVIISISRIKKWRFFGGRGIKNFIFFVFKLLILVIHVAASH